MSISSTVFRNSQPVGMTDVVEHDVMIKRRGWALT